MDLHTDLETRLRNDLAATATDIDSAPAGLFTDVVAGARRQRRNRLAAVGAAACAVVAAVTVPLVVTSGPSSAPAGGDTASPSATAAQTYTRYPYDPRGSLAGDAAYVQGLLDRPWKRLDSHSQLLPEPTRKQVVFAGEVPGGVQALVIGWDEAQVVDGEQQPAGWVGMWLHGAPGTAPADLEFTNEPARVDPSAPMTQSWTLDGVGSLVVVTRPGDVVEYSPGQRIQADGTVVRQDWQRVGDASGIVVVPVEQATDLTRSVRVVRDGRVVATGTDGGSAQGPIEPEADLAPALAGAAGSPDAGLVRTEMSTLLPELGLTQRQVETHVLWGGATGVPGAADAETALFTVQVPSGAVVLVGAVGYDRAGASDGGGFTTVGPCAKELLPAGTDVTATGVAMRCDVHSTKDGSVLGSRLVVVPPAGAASVRVAGSPGTLPVSSGAVVLDAPAGQPQVTALDAAGRELGEVPLYGVEDVRLTD